MILPPAHLDPRHMGKWSYDYGTQDYEYFPPLPHLRKKNTHAHKLSRVVSGGKSFMVECFEESHSPKFSRVGRWSMRSYLTLPPIYLSRVWRSDHRKTRSGCFYCVPDTPLQRSAFYFIFLSLWWPFCDDKPMLPPRLCYKDLIYMCWDYNTSTGNFWSRFFSFCFPRCIVTFFSDVKKMQSPKKDGREELTWHCFFFFYSYLAVSWLLSRGLKKNAVAKKDGREENKLYLKLRFFSLPVRYSQK